MIIQKEKIEINFKQDDWPVFAFVLCRNKNFNSSSVSFPEHLLKYSSSIEYDATSIAPGKCWRIKPFNGNRKGTVGRKLREISTVSTDKMVYPWILKYEMKTWNIWDKEKLCPFYRVICQWNSSCFLYTNLCRRFYGNHKQKCVCEQLK